MSSETTAEISNYIPVSRKFFDHFLWKEDRIYSRAEAWIDLMKECRFSEEEQTHIINGRWVNWGRGQWPVSVRFLAERWGWSGKRVFSFLSLLEQEKMIKKETQEETGQTIVTLCNYEKYNPIFKNGKRQGERRGNSEETARKQRGNETNKDNIENKENNRANALVLGGEEKNLKKAGNSQYQELIKSLPSDSAIKTFWETIKNFITEHKPGFPEPYVDLWNLFATNYKLSKVEGISDSRRKKFNTRLQEDSFDFLRVLEKIKEAPHLKGHNDRGWKVNLDWIIENDKNYLKIIEGQYS